MNNDMPFGIKDGIPFGNTDYTCEVIDDTGNTTMLEEMKKQTELLEKILNRLPKNDHWQAKRAKGEA